MYINIKFIIILRNFTEFKMIYYYTFKMCIIYMAIKIEKYRILLNIYTFSNCFINKIRVDIDIRQIIIKSIPYFHII